MKDAGTGADLPLCCGGSHRLRWADSELITVRLCGVRDVSVHQVQKQEEPAVALLHVLDDLGQCLQDRGGFLGPGLTIDSKAFESLGQPGTAIHQGIGRDPDSAKAFAGEGLGKGFELTGETHAPPLGTVLGGPETGEQ